MCDEFARGPNRCFSYQLRTAASVDQVWHFWSHPDVWQHWDLGLKSATLDGSMKLGAKGQIVPNSGPVTTFEVTEYKARESYTFITKLPGARLQVSRSFVQTHPARIICHRVSFHGPLGFLWAILFGPGFRQALPPTMENLVRLAENTDMRAEV